MIILTDLVVTPKEKLSEAQLKLAEVFSVSFLNDSSGNDWYESQKKFKEDTWKISFNEGGEIICATQDVSAMFPVNSSVAEIDALPSDFSLNGCWSFDIESNQLVCDYVEIAKEKQTALMNGLAPRINELASAEEDGDITEDEKVELAKLREYRSLLRRVDLSSAPVVNWPDAP